MAKRCVIISGGDFSPVDRLYADDFIIACDKGYTYAQRCGIQPDLVVSDFDSYAGEIAPQIPVETFQSEKDDTDTMIAVRYAVAHGFDEVCLRCALGGRLDHAFANLQSLVFAQVHGLRASLEDTGNCVYTLQNGSMHLERREGWSLSVFAACDRCEGVSIRGAKYPLTDAVLTCSFPLGVSNAWAEDAVDISVRDGILLIILSRIE